MRRASIAIWVAVLAAICVVGTAAPVGRVADDCAAGATPANFNGKIVCLAVGSDCEPNLALEYVTQGFQCLGGKFARAPGDPKAPGSRRNATSREDGEDQPPAVGPWAPDVGDLAVSSHGVWVSSGVFRIDAAGNTATGPFSREASPDIGAGAGSVWASDFAGQTLRRFNPRTGKLVATIHMAGGPEGIVVTPTAVWVAEHHGGDVARIDPKTNRIVARIQVGPTGPDGPQGIAFGLGSVWVGVGSVNQVVRIDPTTNTVIARIGLPPNQGITSYGGIGVGKTAVWVSSFVSDAIARIDPKTNTVASILTLSGNVAAIITVGDDAWFVSGGNLDYSPHAVGYLIELRPDDTVARRIDLGSGFVSGGIANAFGSIWVSNWIKPLVLRVPR